MKHPDETQLQDYADGTLTGDARAAVAAHLRSCDACAADVAQLRALVAELRELPLEVTPPRDLLPGIHAGMDAARTLVSQRTLRSMRWPLAAAAVLLVAASSLTTLVLVRTQDTAPSPASPVAASLREVEAEYARAAGELLATLQAERGRLAPETARLIEQDIAVVDQAISEARAELAADPRNRMLPQLLLAAYEQKLTVLRRAAELTQEPDRRS